MHPPVSRGCSVISCGASSKVSTPSIVVVSGIVVAEIAMQRDLMVKRVGKPVGDTKT